MLAALCVFGLLGYQAVNNSCSRPPTYITVNQYTSGATHASLAQVEVWGGGGPTRPPPGPNGGNHCPGSSTESCGRPLRLIADPGLPWPALERNVTPRDHNGTPRLLQALGSMLTASTATLEGVLTATGFAHADTGALLDITRGYIDAVQRRELVRLQQAAFCRCGGQGGGGSGLRGQPKSRHPRCCCRPAMRCCHSTRRVPGPAGCCWLAAGRTCTTTGRRRTSAAWRLAMCPCSSTATMWVWQMSIRQHPHKTRAMAPTAAVHIGAGNLLHLGPAARQC